MPVFTPIEEAIEAFRNGEMLIVVDDEDRENEGDLIIAAEKVTVEQMAFIVRYTGGVICVATTENRLMELELPQMVEHSQDPKKTAFTITIDYKHGTTTGISAHDRCLTINAVGNPKCQASDFQRPGHVFPLRYRNGGVLTRNGHTEATVDLARLAGLYPAGALSEIVSDDGTMMRRPQLEVFSREHNIKMITIADLIKYRYQQETLVSCIQTTSNVATQYGSFTVKLFKDLINSNTHLIIQLGTPSSSSPYLVRVMNGCPLGLYLPQSGCNCFEVYNYVLQRIQKEGSGCVVILRNNNFNYEKDIESRSTDNDNHPHMVNDPHLLGIGCQILNSIGIKHIKLLSVKNQQFPSISGYGLIIDEVEHLPFNY
ncbi:hypothetical protein WA158_003850 [Blastocystis sp. Blastoise]